MVKPLSARFDELGMFFRRDSSTPFTAHMWARPRWTICPPFRTFRSRSRWEESSRGRRPRTGLLSASTRGPRARSNTSPSPFGTVLLIFLSLFFCSCRTLYRASSYRLCLPKKKHCWSSLANARMVPSSRSWTKMGKMRFRPRRRKALDSGPCSRSSLHSVGTANTERLRKP